MCVYIHTYSCVYIHRVCIYIYIYTFIYLLLFTYIYIYIHIYIYISVESGVNRGQREPKIDIRGGCSGNRV